MLRLYRTEAFLRTFRNGSGAAFFTRCISPHNHSSAKSVSSPGRAWFSDWNARGYDITQESLTFGNRPKAILQGYAPTGFDVLNLITKVDPNEMAESGTLHMNGSIIAFPFGCFLWDVQSIEEVTLESLAPVLLHRPKLEYLFVGANVGQIPSHEVSRIRAALQKRNIVFEKLDLSNAMGTFNILNAEDRQVAVALVIDPREE